MKQAIGNERYTHYATGLLLIAYAEGPARLRQCTLDLTETDLRARPLAGKWSIAEIINHLSDAEIIGSCRFRQAYTNHPAPFPYYYEAIWAEALKYQDQTMEDIKTNLELFDLLRKKNMTLFNRFSERDWAKTGIHPERGEMSLRALLEVYADHSERHIEQILERRDMLGRPVSMDCILKDRLY